MAVYSDKDYVDVWNDIQIGVERMAHNVSHMVKKLTDRPLDINEVMEISEFFIRKLEEINDLESFID